MKFILEAYLPVNVPAVKANTACWDTQFVRSPDLRLCLGDEIISEIIAGIPSKKKISNKISSQGLSVPWYVNPVHHDVQWRARAQNVCCQRQRFSKTVRL